MQRACKASANWLGEALPMMGPYLSYVATNDVNGSSSEKVGPMGSIGEAACSKR